MKITFLPKTLAGKWSAGLSIAFIIMISFKMMSLMPIPTRSIAVLGLAGFITGIVALVKNDRAVLAFLSILVGLLIVVWTAAELIYPH